MRDRSMARHGPIHRLSGFLMIMMMAGGLRGQSAAERYDSLVRQAKALLTEKRPVDAGKQAENAIKLDPSRWEAYIVAATAYSDQKLLDEAIGNLQMALARAPESKKDGIRAALVELRKTPGGSQPTKPRPGDAPDLLNQAKDLFNNGKCTEVIETASKAVEVDPDLTEAYTVRGLCRNRQEQYILAVKDWNEVVKRSPESAIGYYNRGTAYVGLKLNDKAVEDLTVAIGLDPRANFYGDRGYINAMMGNHQRAIEDFTEAIKRETEDGPRKNYLKARAVSRQKTGDLIGGIQDLGDAGDREQILGILKVMNIANVMTSTDGGLTNKDTFTAHQSADCSFDITQDHVMNGIGAFQVITAIDLAAVDSVQATAAQVDGWGPMLTVDIHSPSGFSERSNMNGTLSTRRKPFLRISDLNSEATQRFLVKLFTAAAKVCRK